MTKQGKGIYSRNGIYWLAFTVDGKQRHKSLQTRDYGEAVVKAQEIRKRPSLVKIGRWVDDMGIYFDTRQEQEP
jgi:acetylornithine deacetylase/succinyl-diaminopimelate desuccinylase-like protein